MTSRDLLRRLPAVDALLREPALAGALERHGRPLVLAEVRGRLDRLRGLVRSGASGEAVESAAAGLAEAAAEALDRRARGRLLEVINATGVVVHTNLGRAPLGEAAVARLTERAGRGLNLELDLESGRRGRRAPGCEDLLVELSGAEAALVVNNCAAALLLSLNTLAMGRPAVVSRGELVEIGGSFRIPAVCERAGVRLVEVGTTNRTRLADYRHAVEAGGAGVLLKVHPSNFRVVGFTEETPLAQLVALGREHEVPVVMDQGSGALQDLSDAGLSGEPPVSALVGTGADLVLFSGDKLLGGPQAGCLVGRREAVAACRANPLYRALRPGRLTLLALEATLWCHATGRLDQVPVQAQLGLTAGAVQERAEAVRKALTAAGLGDRADLAVVPGHSTSGGGSSPSSELPTFLLRVLARDRGADDVATSLRCGEPAVLARIEEGAVVLDLRTVRPDDDDRLREAVAVALA